MNGPEDQASSLTLVYIHGRTDSDEDGAWYTALSDAYQRLGKGSLEDQGVNTVSPNWLDKLNSSVTSKRSQPPPSTYEPSDDYEVWRGVYNRSANSLKKHLVRSCSDHNHVGLLSRLPETITTPLASAATRLLMKDVGAYCRDDNHRNACINEVLVDLPPTGDIAIIAHSLGSVLAADLLYSLPPGVRLRMLITFGSPLGYGPLRAHVKRVEDRFPFERVGPWINLVGRSDPVSAFGLESTFPEVADFHVRTKWDGSGLRPVKAHHSATYLGLDIAAQALDWLLDEISAGDQEPLPELRLPVDQTRLLFAFQFALRVEQSLPNGSSRERFALARKHCAETLASGLSRSYPQLKLSTSLLLKDNADRISGLTTFDKITLLIIASLSNPIAPFEIEIEDEDRLRAIELVAVDVNGLPSWATVVGESIQQATKAQGEGFSWKKSGLVAGGILGLTAAPFLVVAAAPAGLVGGAAIMGGLAALGPGGAAGGLAVLATVGAGAGTLATIGLTSGTAEDVQQSALLIHASALAARGLDELTGEERATAALESMKFALSVSIDEQTPISDKQSKVLTVEKEKLKAVQRALDHLAGRS